MRAIVRDRYGPADVLELREIDKPGPADDEVLVRVRATSVNPTDWFSMTGTPYIARVALGLQKPKPGTLGVDFAGTVEAVGRDVKQLQPGEDVFGARDGAFADYVCVREERAVVPKPASLTFEQAAAIPVAGLTALQGLRDHGHIQPGQNVLINGASGGVGTLAVQIAKSFGAQVTGVCSSRNVDTVRSIGADHAIDYGREDFTRSEQHYDLILDIAGSRSWSEYRRVLNPTAILVIVGGPKTNRMLGPLSHVVKVRLAAVGSRQKIMFFVAKTSKSDMVVLKELLEAGKLRPVIDRHYGFSEIADAMRYLGEGHAKGKIVITV